LSNILQQVEQGSGLQPEALDAGVLHFVKAADEVGELCHLADLLGGFGSQPVERCTHQASVLDH
jgi:hypothetical protein